MSLSSALDVMLLVHIVLSSIVTLKLFSKDHLESFQIFFQFLIIWLIPIFGAALIYSFVREDEKVISQKKCNDTGSNYGTGSVQPPNSSD